MNRNVVWISSYPKSGRTWLKILLESIYLKNGGKVDINDMKLTSPLTFSRKMIDDYSGLPSSDLRINEIATLKRKYLLDTIGKEKERKILLTHEANHREMNELLFPKEITKSAIQIVRNPLSIVGSFASYMKLSMDESIDHLNGEFYKKRFEFAPSTSIVRKRENSWSEHISSWLNNGEYPVHIVKYEDLIQKPIETLNQLFVFLEDKIEMDILHAAAENCNFKKLYQSEHLNGFNEKPATSERFFRKGKVDSWKEELTNNQIQNVINHHGEMMKKLGYLQ